MDRQDPVHRAKEQIANTDCRQLVRKNPVLRAKEINCRRLDRQDPVCRAQEQIADTDLRRLDRHDPVCRVQEQIANTDRRQLVRQDPACRVQEIDCRGLDRQDPVCKAQEQIADTDSSVGKGHGILAVVDARRLSITPLHLPVGKETSWWQPIIYS